MRTLQSFFAILLLMSTCATFCAGAGNRSGTTVWLVFPEAFTRIGAEAWAAGGTGVSLWGMPGAPLSNPAGLEYPSLGIYLEGAQRFDTKWVSGIDYDGQLIAPLFASIGFPAGAVSLAVGYANVFDLSYSTSIPEATIAMPEGTGRTFDFGSTVKTHVIYGSLSYPVDGQTAVGLTMGIHSVHAHSYTFDLSADGGGIGFLLVAGTLMRFSDRISMGAALHYESSSTFSESYSGPRLTPLSYTEQWYANLVPETYDFTARFPWSFDLGFAWSATRSLSFMAGGEYQNWSHVSDGWNNLVQLHLGTEFAVSDQVRLGAGFFTQDSPNDSPRNPLVENFLTFGIRWAVYPAVNLSASVLDSHLVSSSPSPATFLGSPDDRFRQSSVSIGISYSAPTQ